MTPPRQKTAAMLRFEQRFGWPIETGFAKVLKVMHPRDVAESIKISPSTVSQWTLKFARSARYQPDAERDAGEVRGFLAAWDTDNRRLPPTVRAVLREWLAGQEEER